MGHGCVGLGDGAWAPPLGSVGHGMEAAIRRSRRLTRSLVGSLPPSRCAYMCGAHEGHFDDTIWAMGVSGLGTGHGRLRSARSGMAWRPPYEGHVASLGVSLARFLLAVVRTCVEHTRDTLTTRYGPWVCRAWGRGMGASARLGRAWHGGR